MVSEIMLKSPLNSQTKISASKTNNEKTLHINTEKLKKKWKQSCSVVYNVGKFLQKNNHKVM